MDDVQPYELGEPGTRRIGVVNSRGLWTLYAKEVRRFLKVWTQTVAAPAVTTLLFMLIFALALGGAGRITAGIPFETFLAPGLIMMAIIQNGFQNTVSSILIGKVAGTIVDVLMPPMSPAELVTGYTLGGVTRGLAVGSAVWLTFSLVPGVDVSVSHWWAVIYYALTAASMLAVTGVIAGAWAEKFDHSAAITNFVVVPLSLLSGTFYSIDRLPDTWQMVSQFNPFFYLIDGFRYAFTDHADGSIAIGIAVTLGLNIILWAAALYIFRTGRWLKP